MPFVAQTNLVVPSKLFVCAVPDYIPIYCDVNNDGVIVDSETNQGVRACDTANLNRNPACDISLLTNDDCSKLVGLKTCDILIISSTRYLQCEENTEVAPDSDGILTCMNSAVTNIYSQIPYDLTKKCDFSSDPTKEFENCLKAIEENIPCIALYDWFPDDGINKGPSCSDFCEQYTTKELCTSSPVSACNWYANSSECKIAESCEDVQLNLEYSETCSDYRIHDTNCSVDETDETKCVYVAKSDVENEESKDGAISTSLALSAVLAAILFY